MCIAILNASGTLSKKTLRTCWENNNNGAGMAYWDGTALQTEKELTSFKRFYKMYTNARNKHPTAEIALHFRIATHGRINLDNCHPFNVGPNHAIVHNGIISGHGNDEYSDTHQFAENVLSAFISDQLYISPFVELIESYIEMSKIILVGELGTIIYNEHLGHWNAGNWYSNKTYQTCGFRDYGGKSVPYARNTSRWDELLETDPFESWDGIDKGYNRYLNP